jgi:hypothetical protein
MLVTDFLIEVMKLCTNQKIIRNVAGLQLLIYNFLINSKPRSMGVVLTSNITINRLAGSYCVYV